MEAHPRVQTTADYRVSPCTMFSSLQNLNKKDKDFYWKNLLSSDYHLNNSTAHKLGKFFKKKVPKEIVLKVKNN